MYRVSTHFPSCPFEWIHYRSEYLCAPGANDDDFSDPPESRQNAPLHLRYMRSQSGDLILWVVRGLSLALIVNQQSLPL